MTLRETTRPATEADFDRCRRNLREELCQYCTLKAGFGWVAAEKFFPDLAEAEYAAKRIDARLAVLGFTLERFRPHDDEPWALYVLNAAGEEVTSGNCFKIIEWWLIKQERGIDLNLIFPVEREAKT